MPGYYKDGTPWLDYDEDVLEPGDRFMRSETARKIMQKTQSNFHLLFRQGITPYKRWGVNIYVKESEVVKWLDETHLIDVSVTRNRWLDLTKDEINSVEKDFNGINKYTLDGLFVSEYKTYYEAARSINVNYQSIARCCKHIQKAAYGFIWRFQFECKRSAVEVIQSSDLERD